MSTNEIHDKIRYLFDRPWDEDLSYSEEEELLDEAKRLINEAGWPATYTAAVNYLLEACNTPDSAINFAHMFWGYGWYENPIPNPYRFLAYFYYRINLEVEKYDSPGILDSLAITILPRAGYREADLMHNEDYIPEYDPRILAEVERLRNKTI